jgi:hypothetical protein
MTEKTLEKYRQLVSNTALLIQMTLNYVSNEKQHRMLEFIVYLNKVIYQECKDFLSTEVIQENEDLRHLFSQLEEQGWPE